MMPTRPLLGVVVTILAGSVLPVSRANKVTELISAFHFQDTVRDTPYSARPPSLVAFHSRTDEWCDREFRSWQYDTEGLPERRRLYVASYDIDKQYEFAWFKFTEDMDLPARLEISDCPALAVIPRDWTGRENQTADVRVWDKTGDWRVWANKQIEELDTPEFDEKFTNELLVQRDDGESRCHHRISITPAKLPHYSEKGYDVFEMPDQLYDRLTTYYKKWDHARTVEPWTEDQTETNFHDTHMSLVSLDHDHVERDSMANDHIRPMISEWVGISEQDLALKSFYGIREYFRGNELRTHIDVINTHVLSAVLCIDQVGIDEDWMLEVIDHFGNRVEVACKPKQVILYESASLPHGRPFPFNGTKFVNAFVHYQPKGWDFIERTWGIVSSPTNFKGPQAEKSDFEDFEVDTEAQSTDEEYAPPPDVVDDGRRKAIFINRASSERDLWWQGPEGIVLQGPVRSGGAVEINSFIGHKFIWSTTERSPTQTGTPHQSGAEALRGDRIGETVEITSAMQQEYSVTDEHDEL